MGGRKLPYSACNKANGRKLEGRDDKYVPWFRRRRYVNVTNENGLGE